ncbi:MAG: metal ABC transporter permease [Clostridia bacterium]
MMELFQYGFMRRALAAGMIVGVLCPLIGIFLVLRRMSLIGDSLSHVALAGVAAGIVSGVYPPVAALAFSVAAALGIEQLGKKYPEHAELAIAVILSAGIGTAVILVSYAKYINIDLFGYLFGNILTVGPGDMGLIAALGSFILLFVSIYFRELFYIAFDEEGARIAGIPVKKINLLFTILVAMTITLSMRIVGALLVSSLMVIPVAAGMQTAKSFKHAVLMSVVFAQISVVLGIVFSYYLGLASGGTIVLLSVVLLMLVLGFKSLSNNR